MSIVVKKYYNEPVTSYGVICFRKNIQKNVIEVIMIRRNHTVGYLEMIRGAGGGQYLPNLINEMTLLEKQNLINSVSADQLLDEVSLLQGSGYKREKARKRYKDIISSGQATNWVEESNTSWIEPEWGFPKGRKNSGESDEACARREFIEETSMSSHHFIILPCKPVVELFKGTNNVCYKHVYYIALVTHSNGGDARLDKKNWMQSIEVGSIEWLDKEGALQKIRPSHPEKKCVLLEAFSIIEEFSYAETVG